MTIYRNMCELVDKTPTDLEKEAEYVIRSLALDKKISFAEKLPGLGHHCELTA